MYGITISSAIFIAVLVAERFVTTQKKREILWGGVVWAVVAGIIGARLYHVADFLEYYTANPLYIFAVWQGGLGIYGGLIGGSLGLAQYLKAKKEPLLPWLDLAGIVTPLGQTIGRWGNYFNREHLPYALYESLANFLLFITLVSFKKWGGKRTPGWVFSTYLIGYGIIRFSLEFIKTEPGLLYDLSMAQLLALGFVMTGILARFAIIKK